MVASGASAHRTLAGPAEPPPELLILSGVHDKKGS